MPEKISRTEQPTPRSDSQHGHGALPDEALVGRDGSEGEARYAGIRRLDLARVLFMALAAAAVWFRVWEPLSRISVIGLFATLVGGYPIFKEAIKNIAGRKMTMELSMTIALGAAMFVGEFFTAIVITMFVLAAEILEGLTVSRGRRAIRQLLDYLPRTVLLRKNGEAVEAPAESVRLGDSVLVNPGVLMPVDGAVTAGHSYVDEAAVTGESMPVAKTVGSWVFAGTINQSGALEVRTERLGRDTTFGRIIEAVEHAGRSKAPVQKTADRLAGYLVYFALGAAALTFAVTRDVRSTISVIIVAGACGIAAGTPLAILGAIGQAARRGVVIKGGLHLEVLAKANTVVLDKTGTLTYGSPEVIEVRPAGAWSERQLIEAAAFAERRSEHPLGKAILKHAHQLSTPIRNYGDVFRERQAAAGNAPALRRCMRAARSARVKVQRKGTADFS